jgi:hypothetical protein
MNKQLFAQYIAALDDFRYKNILLVLNSCVFAIRELRILQEKYFDVRVDLK